MADFTHFSVRPLAGAIGALIEEIDLQQPITAETIAEIRAAWLKYGVTLHGDTPR